MLNIILFGPPGAGKGTQAKKLAQHYNLIHISTGEILRNELAKQTELGKLAQKYMNKGELVPDDVIISMVENVIKQHLQSKGFIFDGFPRTIPQAEALDKMLAKYNLKIDACIRLKVSTEELIKRLQKRAEIEGRDDDKDISVIENRIKVYREKTEPVQDYYKNQFKLYIVHGEGTIDEVFEKLKAVIDQLIPNRFQF